MNQDPEAKKNMKKDHQGRAQNARSNKKLALVLLRLISLIHTSIGTFFGYLLRRWGLSLGIRQMYEKDSVFLPGVMCTRSLLLFRTHAIASKDFPRKTREPCSGGLFPSVEYLDFTRDDGPRW